MGGHQLLAENQAATASSHQISLARGRISQGTLLGNRKELLLAHQQTPQTLQLEKQPRQRCLSADVLSAGRIDQHQQEVDGQLQLLREGQVCRNQEVMLFILISKIAQNNIRYHHSMED